jgi:protein O-GlcNAc transferase
VKAYQTYLKARDTEKGWDVESNLEQAIALYREALKQDPDFAAAHAGLASALLMEFRKRNQPELLSSASESARSAVGLDPNLPEALLAYGAAQLQSGNSIEAQDAFARAMQFAPGDDAACRSLAAIYASSGRKEEAREMYARAMALRPSYWVNHYVFGTFQWQYAGDLKAARASLEKATQLHPQGYAPVVMLGNFHLIQGNLEEAESYFRKAMELSKNPYAYNNLGLVHYYRGQYDLALRNWQSLLKDAPDKPIYSANVADALRQLKRGEEAEASYQKAIEGFRKLLEANRGDDTTRSYLSMALAATGYCAEAIRETRSVLSRHADSPEMSVYAAITASRCGELDWAQQIVLRSIASDNLLIIRFDPDLERIRQRPEIRIALQRLVSDR